MAPSASPAPKKPLPQPVEESKRSIRSSSTKERSAESSRQKPGRSLPQPVETSSKSSKKQASGLTVGSRAPIQPQTSTSTNCLPRSDEAQNSSSEMPVKPKKFAPQVIETTRRSRRNTDSSDASTDTANLSPSRQESLPRHLQASSGATAPESAPTQHSEQLSQVLESRFSSSNLAQKQPRRHSFRVPDLPAISSISESTTNHSDDDSTSDDSDHTTTSKKRRKYKRLPQARESQDERFSGYLLSLAAKAAEKQLREQAMAAYPNENVYEPVHHYAIDPDSDESDVETGVGQLSVRESHAKDESVLATRRDSGGWDVAEMRKHQEKLEQQRHDLWAAEPQSPGVAKSDKSYSERPPSSAANVAPSQPLTAWQREQAELKAMRAAASPPMAGQHLKFPKCLSPQATRLDVHQYPGQHGRGSQTETRQHTGLWTPKGGASHEEPREGLWMGVNHVQHQAALAPPKTRQTGLMTPAVESGNPFEGRGAMNPRRLDSNIVNGSGKSLPGPPSSQEGANHSSGQVRTSKGVGHGTQSTIEAELDDAFVTQVYNYLSLGYPSLARPYDEELAKITKIDVQTLKKDDATADAKGYVGAPEGTGLDVRGCRAGACQRWLALRLYVHEWGRQQLLSQDAGGPGWEKTETVNNEGGWGARARKGSWAI